MSSKSDIRRRMRRRRRAVTEDARRRAARGVTAALNRLPGFNAARRVALFAASDGEIDPAPIVTRRPDKQYYLPIIPAPGRRRMRFAPLAADTSYRKNRYGILEPDVPTRLLVTALELDLVLTPLVAFDRAGGRLGMGGGYYDATFAFLASRRIWHAPRIVGVAFAFQETQRIDSDPWDIPLSAVVTEAGAIHLGPVNASPGGRVAAQIGPGQARGEKFSDAK